MDSRPIGVFDSGLGGLTVVKEIKKILPNESIVYLGDTARVPYGTRSRETVTQFSLQNVKFLIKKEVKCVVIACNTSSAQASDKLREKSPVVVFDVIGPGVSAAASDRKSAKIGVIGTRGTIRSHAYERAIKRKNPKVAVVEVSCPLFVPLIEEGELKGRLIEVLADKYLGPLKRKRINTLILGCTHYPFIKSVIAGKMGSKVKIVDSGKELAKELSKYLVEENIFAPKANRVQDEYYVTDLTDRFVKIAEMFLGEKIGDKIKKVSLD